MKRFFIISSSSSMIIGSIIGAGFITGREVASFFCGDMAVSSLYLTFVLFAVCIGVASGADINAPTTRFFLSAARIFNVIITACMLAACNESFKLLCHTENNEILLMITVFIAFFISRNGVGGTEKFSLVFLPVALIVFIILLCMREEIDITALRISPATFTGGALSPLLYVGMNVFFSLPVIIASGENKSVYERITISTVSALALTVCISVIGLVIVKGEVSDRPLPVADLFSDNAIKFAIIGIISFIGIFSTLVCSVFAASQFCGIKFSLFKKILLGLFCVALSKLGFTYIVDKIYPITGVAGIVYVVCLILSQYFFRGRRLPRTSAPQGRTVSRCLPLRDRV